MKAAGASPVAFCSSRKKPEPGSFPPGSSSHSRLLLEFVGRDQNGRQLNVRVGDLLTLNEGVDRRHTLVTHLIWVLGDDRVDRAVLHQWQDLRARVEGNDLDFLVDALRLRGLSSS